ncbi:response regulator transcription factor [Streptomyces sp. B21-083]|uniref:response regulator transcription factor n=1 Tax=Streptomyces sp. B21-083 TaxID=3039410 RepID=UPI002FF21B7A
MRVVLAEDLFLLRDGLVRLLEAYDFEIAAAVESGPELGRALAELAPDVADGGTSRFERSRELRDDVRLPPTHTDEGLQCALRARRARPGLPVLVLSQHVERLYARELPADGDGGVGYLLKDRVLDAEQFVDAVRRVAAGGTAMDPQVIQQLLLARAGDGRPLGRLTPRELEVMELMAQGRSNAAIAGHLVVTERAIAKHTSNIFAKLGLEVSDDDNRRVLAVLTYLDQGR